MTDPVELVELFENDRETHIYGLADLEDPYWSHSSWYRDGDACVGIVSDGSDWLTGYAMSQVAPDETVALLAEINPELPRHTWVTGPSNISRALDGKRHRRSIGPHLRMILDDTDRVQDDQGVVPLGAADISAVEDLSASDPGRAFFLKSMLVGNPFVGLYDGGRLVAMAGTHVASRRFGVAAIGGVLTRPSHRGRGLGRRVVGAICSRIAKEYRTIGLNVSTENAPAIALYKRLGFRTAFEYEEIELL